MKVYFWVLLMVLLLACEGTDKFSKNELEQILQGRYGVEFEVVSNEFNFEINKSQFIAFPTSNPEIEVHGSYHDNKSEVEDNYLQMKHCYQAELFLTNLLKPYYQQVAVYANVASTLQETQNDLPPFKEFVKMKEADPIINFHIYLFQTIDQNNKAMLSGIVKAANYFNESSYGLYTFRVSFWSSEFLKGREFNDLNFGFNYKSDKYDDNLEDEKEFLKQELVFEFDASEQPSITEERLFSLVLPFNKGQNRQYNRL